MTGFHKRLLVSMAVVGFSVVGLTLQSTVAVGAEATPHAKVTIGSKIYRYTGGQCPTIINSSQDDFSFGHGQADGIEFIGKVHGGKFTNIDIALVKGKFSDGVNKNSGILNAKGGTFKGTDVYGTKVTGTFSC